MMKLLQNSNDDVLKNYDHHIHGYYGYSQPQVVRYDLNSVVVVDVVDYDEDSGGYYHHSQRQ